MNLSALMIEPFYGDGVPVALVLEPLFDEPPPVLTIPLKAFSPRYPEVQKFQTP